MPSDLTRRHLLAGMSGALVASSGCLSMPSVGIGNSCEAEPLPKPEPDDDYWADPRNYPDSPATFEARWVYAQRFEETYLWNYWLEELGADFRSMTANPTNEAHEEDGDRLTVLFRTGTTIRTERDGTPSILEGGTRAAYYFDDEKLVRESVYHRDASEPDPTTLDRETILENGEVLECFE